ncbi:MAG: 4'-phosphopantetheinyl transferase superfamily protein, partial [Ginsengibacter sp.]
MSEQIKKIVSEYTKMSMDQLQSETRIGRSALGNSIILHRMYAAIAKEGFEVQGYQNVKTFGELENKILQAQNRGGSTKNNELKAAVSNNQFNEAPGIGVDIEETSQMPRADDFREDEFYQMNFTPQEIAYCISQPDQYASFTGI